MISQGEARRMLEYAKTQYIRAIVPTDAAFWRKRIRVLEAEVRKPSIR